MLVRLVGEQKKKEADQKMIRLTDMTCQIDMSFIPSNSG